MHKIRVSPIPTEHAHAFWNGGKDAHDMAPERHLSDGSGVPCRHCLQQVAAGEPYLILAYCPFPRSQPYAEVGPIFLHANPCKPYQEDDRIPSMYLGGEPRIVRAYSDKDRIRYDTGKVVPPDTIAEYAACLLSDPQTAYVHVRSSMNNCYAFRIDRSA